MNIGKGFLLTYCTNIHPGETWEAVWESLKQYVLPIKANISPNKPFGLGLRLSNQASEELEAGGHLAQFKSWLDDNGLFVFLLNGFPFGSFHRSVVNDEVHQPDWTTLERLEYTRRLARILAYLLPEELAGGVSTSPLSYKPWLKNEPAKTREVFQTATRHLALLVEDLYQLRQETGRLIHLDIEPEPDGLLENTEEFVQYYEEWLIPGVTDYLQTRLGMSAETAQEIIKTHIQLCYDVCHFALAYEEPEAVFNRLERKGIKIGRAQISAALKADLPADPAARQELASQFQAFAESTYLHQVVVRNTDGSLTQYPDLPQALEHFRDPEAAEWRSHFHVPVFLERYNQLHSTQAEILKVVALLKKRPLTHNLEIETYTWEVLPPEIKLDLGASIQRELEWLCQKMEE
jgi:sugar phosphate isomerase/epimerase